MKVLQRALAAGAVVLLAACTAPEFGPEGPGETFDTAIGTVLSDAGVMTLYTYAPDEPGQSNCTGICAIFWPPAEAAPGAQPHDGFSLVPRENGSLQWAYEGQPLYGFLEDIYPGDVNGDGEDDVWFAARP